MDEADSVASRSCAHFHPTFSKVLLRLKESTQYRPTFCGRICAVFKSPTEFVIEPMVTKLSKRNRLFVAISSI
ncbi:MAG: hypothetical protein ACLUKN_03225 [Bacilli bacterium]